MEQETEEGRNHPDGRAEGGSAGAEGGRGVGGGIPGAASGELLAWLAGQLLTNQQINQNKKIL